MLSAYDVVAPSFDRHRRLPDGAADAIRAAILARLSVSAPRLLEIGAGSGRIGSAFVANGDGYIGLDLSEGMLSEFAARSPHACLIRANGGSLPFRDMAFDAVLLIQVFGGLQNWPQVIAEAQRVLRLSGAVILGRTRMADDGVDARMKARLGAILSELGAARERQNVREDVEQSLKSAARSHEAVTAATWTATRTPRGFIERHGSGARFSQLPELAKTQAIRDLSGWAVDTFGSLDRAFSEPHSFELQVFRFENGNQ